MDVNLEKFTYEDGGASKDQMPEARSERTRYER
jgi:hypothetical protein